MRERVRERERGGWKEGWREGKRGWVGGMGGWELPMMTKRRKRVMICRWRDTMVMMGQKGWVERCQER